MAQMTQTPNFAAPSLLAATQAELTEEPRFLSVSASLKNAELQDSELRRLAISVDPEDTQTAIAILQSEAISAPEIQLVPEIRGHPDASSWLLRA